MVTTAFLAHAHHQADSLGIPDLPLVVTPHPLNDLAEGDVRELARAALPHLLAHLTQPRPVEARVEFVHPAARKGGAVAAAAVTAPTA